MTLPTPTRFIDANGQRFAVDEVGEGDRVALLLHGFPQTRAAWRHLMAPLAARGWHVAAPDMRGHGQSTRPAAREAYRMEHLVADVAALFDALDARQRLLIGHDWGAGVAWAFALARARPLDGLVAVNVPHPKVFADVLRRSAEQKRKSWYAGFFQIPWLPEKLLTLRGAYAVGAMIANSSRDRSRFPPAMLDIYRTAALQPGAMTAMLAYYRATGQEVMRKRSYPPIDVPTLLIWGEDDVALSLELTKGYDALVADFTLERLPGVSHWVPEEAPELLDAKLTAWLKTKSLA